MIVGYFPQKVMIRQKDLSLTRKIWHERSEDTRKINREHVAASKIAYRWRTGNTIDSLNEKAINERVNFWKEVLKIIVNIILTMAVLCLAFRGHRESVGEAVCEGGNFLGIVMMQARFDPFLREIINSPTHQVRYLCASIQNEIIDLLATATRKSLIKKIQRSPFYSIMMDTTSDISRIDQLSVIIRWIDVEDMEVNETFLGFLKVTDPSAQGLCDIIIKYLKELGIDIMKVRGQCYDEASVMRASKGGCQKKLRDLKSKGVETPIPFVHCDAIRAIKSRYVHILKVLTKIGLSSKDSKERAMQFR